MRAPRDVRLFRRGAQPPAEPWTPASIPGLVLWLDNTLITESGGLVTAWPDISGVGNHFTQGSPAVQPTYVLLDANFATPQPSVSFAGSQDRLDSSAAWNVRWIAVVGHHPASTFGAFNCVLGTTVNGPVIRFMIGGTGSANWSRAVGNPAATAVYTRDGTVTDAALTTAGAPHLWEAEWAADVGAAPNLWRLGADGAPANEWPGAVALVLMATAVPDAATKAALRTYCQGRGMIP